MDPQTEQRLPDCMTFYGRSSCDHFLRSPMLSSNRSSALFSVTINGHADAIEPLMMVDNVGGDIKCSRAKKQIRGACACVCLCANLTWSVNLSHGESRKNIKRDRYILLKKAIKLYTAAEQISFITTEVFL